MVQAVSITDLQNAYTDLQTIQSVANDLGPTVTTRLGNTAYTLQGLLARIGYLPPVAYSSGLVVNNTLITVTSGGLLYAPLPNLVPFTTSGAFNPAQWFLVQIAPSAFIQTLLDDTTAAIARATLGAAASGANTDLTSLLLSNTGLVVKDVGGSFGLNLKPGSTLTANRILTLTTGDNARTLDISAANVTIAAFIATLLDDTSASAALTTLGVSAFMKTVLDDADAPTARGTLGLLDYIHFDIGDETTTITAANGKMAKRAPAACKIVGLPRASLTTASTSGLPAIRINKNGSTIFTTNITLDATEKTSVTAATPCVLNATPVTFADDDEITIDVTVAGTGAKGLKVVIPVQYT